MRLTSCTDHALRTLIYLAARQRRLVTIAEIADYHAIPKNHLSKVVHRLAQAGLVRTVRGRQGGIALGMPPSAIRIGAVVRATEPDFRIAPCFASAAATCPHAGGCGLQGVLARATRAWLAELDGATLADVMAAHDDVMAAEDKVVDELDAVPATVPPASAVDAAVRAAVAPPAASGPA